MVFPSIGLSIYLFGPINWRLLLVLVASFGRLAPKAPLARAEI